MGDVLKAVIFDVDGVLVDSWRAHLQGWQRLAREDGVSLTEDDFARGFGRTSREIFELLWPAGRLDPERIARLDAVKEGYYRETVSTAFPAMPGATALIDALHEDGLALGVGSSGPPENVALALDRLERRDRFAAVVTGSDVTRGKPDPQVFLRVAERLELEPRACLVIEDAAAGVRAAHAAGMPAVALLSTGRKREDFADDPPERFATRLDELDPGILRQVALLYDGGANGA